MGKNATSKAYIDRQRKNKDNWSKSSMTNAEITTSEVKCQKCGFKARYQFYRCPECNEAQE